MLITVLPLSSPAFSFFSKRKPSAQPPHLQPRPPHPQHHTQKHPHPTSHTKKPSSQILHPFVLHKNQAIYSFATSVKNARFPRMKRNCTGKGFLWLLYFVYREKGFTRISKASFILPYKPGPKKPPFLPLFFDVRFTSHLVEDFDRIVSPSMP